MQHDAACRVIARLRIERDEAQNLLLKAERQVPSTIAAPAPAAPTVTSNGKRGELNKFVYLLLFDFVLEVYYFSYQGKGSELPGVATNDPVVPDVLWFFQSYGN